MSEWRTPFTSEMRTFFPSELRTRLTEFRTRLTEFRTRLTEFRTRFAVPTVDCAAHIPKGLSAVNGSTVRCQPLPAHLSRGPQAEANVA